MKLLFFTDSHIRVTNPRNRIDNFLESCEQKFLEIRDYANQNKIDYIIHGGDIFDRPDASIKSVSEIGKILQSFEMPIYIVSGNHDVYGYNQDTLDRTMLGLFSSLGILNLIPKDGKVLEKDGIKVLLLGKNYTIDLDKDKDNYIVKKENLKYESDYIVNVVHGFLTDKPFFKTVPHVLVGEILETDADITLAGHYHLGFKTIFENNRYFSNPGSLMRLSNSKSEITRVPKFLEINLNEKGIRIEDRFLKCAKPGYEVLDRKVMEASQFRMENLMEFSNYVEQKFELDRLDLEMILNNIAESEDFSETVQKEAKIRIQKAKEILDDTNN